MKVVTSLHAEKKLDSISVDKVASRVSSSQQFLKFLTSLAQFDDCAAMNKLLVNFRATVKVLKIPYDWSLCEDALRCIFDQR